MDSNFWLNKWENGETRFHQSQYHHLLVKYGDKLTKGTILVPLSGKSLDMRYLITKGHTVVGVELSSIACKDFFKEAGIEYTTSLVDDFTVFSSDQITIWCGDFFKLPQVVWDKVTGVYDRAALIALPEEIRKTYAAEFLQRCPGQLEILLITLEYSKDTLQGPPFCVDEEEVNRIYSSLKIQKIHSEKEEKLTKDKSIEITENVYWMKKN